MYFGLCFCIAEMSPALPHTGGAYSFARSAMGPWGGFITGLAENMEYVVTPAVVVGAMGFLMHDVMARLFDIVGEPVVEQLRHVDARLLRDLRRPQHRRHRGDDAVHGRHQLPRARDPACSSSSRRLLRRLRLQRSSRTSRRRTGELAVPPVRDQRIFKALPFAIWFYLAIEELPLAAEESMDPKRDIPKGDDAGA